MNQGMTKGDSLRRNNFDLLRLLLAAGVMLDHSHDLSRVHALQWLDDAINTETMLQGFFVISGFLIVMSYEKSRSLFDYTERRARRIYPAYFVVVMLGLLLGAAFTSLPLGTFFTAKDTFKYVISNLLFMNFLQPGLPGVFTHQHMDAINGSLWSLKVEVMFYVTVPLIVWLIRKSKAWPVLLGIYIASWGYKFGLDYYETHGHVVASLGNEGHAGLFKTLGKQLFGQLPYFMAGAAGYYYRDFVARYAKALLAITAIILVADWRLPLGFLQPAALGIFIVLLACHIPYLGNAGRYGDMSYGVYIFHFPIIQSLIALGLYNTHPWLALAATISLVLVCAFISWHLIEKRWLRPSSHYRQVETKTDSTLETSSARSIS